MVMAVEAIARLAYDFYAAGNLSAVELVRRSGYLSDPNATSASGLARVLDEHPEWADAWWTYVDDYRSSPAWAIAPRADGAYEVWYFEPGAGSRSGATVIQGRTEAIAEYVKRHVDDIARPAVQRDASGDIHRR